MTAKIYIEGGGDGEALHTLFREGWRRFFEAAGLAGHMPRVVPGRGRVQTFDLFLTALGNPRPGELPLLLVDSEGPVTPAHTVWQHLKTQANWDRPKAAGDDCAFLMVQIMETWFLADHGLLREYFGASLREQHLREWPTLETLTKDTVMGALDGATAGCPKSYSKGKISYDLLGRLNPEHVQARCPHAKV